VVRGLLFIERVGCREVLRVKTNDTFTALWLDVRIPASPSQDEGYIPSTKCRIRYVFKFFCLGVRQIETDRVKSKNFS
jgi:hypothetical protein